MYYLFYSEQPSISELEADKHQTQKASDRMPLKILLNGFYIF